MSKHIQLSIDSPCHENWDNMASKEQGRFCASCQKTVIDFSNMSDSQLATFFKKPSGSSVCGRFYHDQLSRDIEIPKKRIPWVKYFFQILIPAFLASAKVSAQSSIAGKPVAAAVTKKVSARKDINDTLPSVGLLVVPEIKILDYKTNNLQNMPINTPATCDQQIINATLQGFVGGISISSKSIRKNNRQARRLIDSISLFTKPIQQLTQKFMDTASKLFKVFPNPVSSGTSVHIEWKEAEEGYFLLELIDLSGKKVFSKETWIDKEARVLNLEIPSVAPGNYFLKATNKNSGKSFTEKMIIQ